MSLSNTATPIYYGQFRDAVLRGEIPVCREVAMEMNRIDDLIANPGVYYDDEAVEGWIKYCESELTLTDGSDMNLLDSFKLWGEQIFGWYYFIERTANEETMLNYHNRTVEPILSTIADEMTRTFLTKTARTQKQAVSFFRDPFKISPVSQIAEIADKFTRNEIMTKNEFRSIIGMRPSDDPRADELRNSNINQSEADQALLDSKVENQNGDSEQKSKEEQLAE